MLLGYPKNKQKQTKRKFGKTSLSESLLLACFYRDAACPRTEVERWWGQWGGQMRDAGDTAAMRDLPSRAVVYPPWHEPGVGALGVVAL